MKLLFTTLLFIVLCLQLAAQQPGTLDKTFGDGGKVISSTYEGESYCSVLQPDGKIVVGGIRYDQPANAALLVRYNTDGTLDFSFGDSGSAVITAPGLVYALALQKDGKILAAITGYSSFAVMRINEDGTMDKSFGKAGVAAGLTNDGYSDADMAVLPDGRIVITGDVSARINDDKRSFIGCFTAEGQLDKSFGEGGVSIIELSSAMNINTVAATPDNKIVVGGQYWFYNKTILLRYNGDGTIDKSFGTNGITEMLFDQSVYRPVIRDIAIAGDNTIVAAGWTKLDYKNEVILVSRLLANGTPDSSFGTNGYTATKYEEGDARANAVAIQQDGKTIAGGYFLSGEKLLFTTARYGKDGIIDSTFGNNGIQNTYFYGHDEGRSLIIQNDGKIVISGSSSIPPDDKFVTTLARYNGDDNSKQPLLVRIKRWMLHHGISWQYNSNVRYYSVQRSLDGGITYKQVAKVYVAANKQLYNYEDATAQAASSGSNACYRLAVITKDGTRTYSNTVLIDESANVKVFPNPARDNLQLQGLPASGKTNVSVMDLYGNVRSKSVAGSSNYTVSTANLTPGNYLLKIEHNNTATTQAFVKE